MKWSERTRGLMRQLGKFKYPLLVLLLGLVILAIPGRDAEAPPEEPAAPAAETAAEAAEDGLTSLEQRLSALLSKMEGAGRVEVILQYAAGPRVVYQTDSNQEVTTDAEGKRTVAQMETVLSPGGSTDGPVTVQTIEPSFRGALIAAEGADDAAVKLDLVSAVSSLTGLGADDITVIKMK